MRFGDRLRVAREVPEAALACAVPTLLLQPLVENAVVHGIAPFPSPGSVLLRAWRDGSFLVLEVTNTCGPAGDDPPDGPLAFTPRVGLTNTRTRLEALYGTTFRFELKRSPEGGIRAEVAIPWKWSQP
jgi:LytS/YehU family sensor histidine kinase